MKFTKKLLGFAVVLTLLVLLLTLGASAEIKSGNCGVEGNESSVTWSFDTETGKLTISGEGAIFSYADKADAPWYSFRSSVTSLIIEEGITAIGTRAFNELNITELTLPTSTTKIDEYAFQSCKLVTKITISGEISGIYNQAFNNCIALTDLTINEGTEIISARAFQNCTSLESVRIPASCTRVGTKGLSSGDSVFKNCSKLKSITVLGANTPIYGNLPTNNEITIYSFGGSKAKEYADANTTDNVVFDYIIDGGTCGAEVNWTFDLETGLLTISGKGKMTDYSSTSHAPWRNLYNNYISKIVIEEGVTSVGKFAFSECSVETAVIADSVTTIKGYSFRICKNLTDIHIGSGVTYIADYVINDCDALETLVIPGNVTEIENHAVNGCDNLTSITLGEGVKTIKHQAINNCNALTEITIPSTVKTFGKADKAYSAIYACNGLKKINFLSCDATIYPDSADAFPASATIYGYKGSTVDQWAGKYNRSIEYITSVGGKCGENVTWSLDLDTGVLTISGNGPMANYAKDSPAPWNPTYNKAISKIVIEEGVTSVGKYAFSECSVETVVIADSVKTINGYSFRVCEKLTDIHIGSGVTYIGDYVINGCHALESLVIPGNVKELEHHAINNCDKLTSIILEEGIETLKYQAINACEALVEITIPTTVKDFGSSGKEYSAINACSALAKVTFLSRDAKIHLDSAAAIPTSATVYGYKGSTVEAWANKYNRSFVEIPVPFAYHTITAFDITVGDVKANAGEYLTIASLERTIANGKATLDFLALDEKGALWVYNFDGSLTPLVNSEGEAIVVANGTKISVVYNDENGTARVYVNGTVPRYGEDLKLVVNYTVASEDFLAATAVTDNLVFAEGVVANGVKNVSDGPALFAGFQTNEAHTDIRIIAGIDSLYYDSIGFEISLYSDDVLQNTLVKTTNKVFSSLINENESITAEELGFDYLALATVSSVDLSKFSENSEVYFKIKPFSTICGEKLYGVEKRITVTYDYTNKENVFTYGVAAPFVPVLRFIATSDIHFKDASNGVGDGAPKLKTMISQLSEFVLDESKNDGYAGLDAVILAGDIANNGTADQLETAKNYLDDIIPEDMELVITMGNHDWLGWETNTPAGNLAQFEAVFGDATKDTVINGYHFITICDDGIPTGSSAWRGYGWDYSAETLAEAEAMIQAALEDTGPDKPIFIIQHVPNADTVAGSNDMVPCNTLKEMQAKYPNLVIFAGHSHHPINDECSIYQEDNTMIGTGTIQVAQVHLVEVDEYGRVRLRKYSSSTKDFLGETWFIDTYDPREFVYTRDRFEEDDLFFAEDAEIIPVYIGFDNISFKFLPVQAESLTARGYRIVLKDASGAVISSEIVEHSYRNEDFSTPISHSFAELAESTEYSIEVYALNPMFETDFGLDGMFESEPLVLDFKTASESDFSGGDLITLYVNAKAQSAVNVASSGVTSAVKGTPTFSHDSTIGMDVISFNGTDKQAVSHNFYSVYEQLVDGFSIEAYFKIDEAPTEKDVVAFGAMQSCWFALSVKKDGTLSFAIHSGGSDYNRLYTTEKYEVGRYYHVVATYDQSHAKLYVDGVLVDSIEMTNLKVHSKSEAYKLLVGADQSLDTVMEAMSKTTFAKFNMYSEPLSETEIKSAYDALK